MASLKTGVWVLRIGRFCTIKKMLAFSNEFINGMLISLKKPRANITRLFGEIME